MKLTKWLKPLLPDGGRKDVKYLILWTFPGQETLDANQDRENPDEPIYYCDLSNRFWKVMEGVFWKGNSEIFNQLNQAIRSEDWGSVYKLQKEICTKYGIALRDRVDECYLSDSSEDAKRLPKTYNTYSECIEKIKSRNITVLLNWKSKGEKLNRKRASEYRKMSEKYRKISEKYRKISEEYRKISEEYRDDLTKWMNYCVIDSLLSKKSTVPKQFTVPKQSTSSSNPKWIKEILDNWKKNLK